MPVIQLMVACHQNDGLVLESLARPLDTGALAWMSPCQHDRVHRLQHLGIGLKRRKLDMEIRQNKKKSHGAHLTLERLRIAGSNQRDLIHSTITKAQTRKNIVHA